MYSDPGGGEVYDYLGRRKRVTTYDRDWHLEELLLGQMRHSNAFPNSFGILSAYLART